MCENVLNIHIGKDVKYITVYPLRNETIKDYDYTKVNYMENVGENTEYQDIYALWSELYKNMH